jgi:hypothetical protein
VSLNKLRKKPIVSLISSEHKEWCELVKYSMDHMKAICSVFSLRGRHMWKQAASNPGYSAVLLCLQARVFWKHVTVRHVFPRLSKHQTVSPNVLFPPISVPSKTYSTAMVFNLISSRTPRSNFSSTSYPQLLVCNSSYIQTIIDI